MVAETMPATSDAVSNEIQLLNILLFGPFLIMNQADQSVFYLFLGAAFGLVFLQLIFPLDEHLKCNKCFFCIHYFCKI